MSKRYNEIKYILFLTALCWLATNVICAGVLSEEIIKIVENNRKNEEAYHTLQNKQLFDDKQRRIKGLCVIEMFIVLTKKLSFLSAQPALVHNSRPTISSTNTFKQSEASAFKPLSSALSQALESGTTPSDSISSADSFINAGTATNTNGRYTLSIGLTQIEFQRIIEMLIQVKTNYIIMFCNNYKDQLNAAFMHGNSLDGTLDTSSINGQLDIIHTAVYLLHTSLIQTLFKNNDLYLMLSLFLNKLEALEKEAIRIAEKIPKNLAVAVLDQMWVLANGDRYIYPWVTNIKPFSFCLSLDPYCLPGSRINLAILDNSAPIIHFQKLSLECHRSSNPKNALIEYAQLFTVFKHFQAKALVIDETLATLVQADSYYPNTHIPAPDMEEIYLVHSSCSTILFLKNVFQFPSLKSVNNMMPKMTYTGYSLTLFRNDIENRLGYVLSDIFTQRIYNSNYYQENAPRIKIHTLNIYLNTSKNQALSTHNSNQNYSASLSNALEDISALIKHYTIDTLNIELLNILDRISFSDILAQMLIPVPNNSIATTNQIAIEYMGTTNANTAIIALNEVQLINQLNLRITIQAPLNASEISAVLVPYIKYCCNLLGQANFPYIKQLHITIDCRANYFAPLGYTPITSVLSDPDIRSPNIETILFSIIMP
ncbi:hypothetical protein NEOKW01_1824 [Nematocida sp. AWRm80]|nr:hypothetical protein NEOKW01_1824 [Nematocida sp. AWRm80]